MTWELSGEDNFEALARRAVAAVPRGSREGASHHGCRNDGVQTPAVRDTFERVCSPALQMQSRPEHEVFHCLGNEYLGRTRERGDPSGDVHCEPADVGAEQLDLARVQTGADLDAQAAGAVDHRPGTADSARRPVESREEAVPRLLHFPTAERLDLRAHQRVMPREQIAPGPVSELGRAAGRVDDVGEQDRREDAIGLAGLACPRQELLNLVGDRLDVAGHRQVVGAGEFHEAGTGDQPYEVPAMRDRNRVDTSSRKRTPDVAFYVLGGSAAGGRRRHVAIIGRPFRVFLMRDGCDRPLLARR